MFSTSSMSSAIPAQEIKHQIQQKARALRFESCRVTTAAAPQTGREFQEWITRQEHGEMAYLERNGAKRLDPQLVLAGAKSIVTLAMSYGGSITSGVKQPASKGVIACYAQLTDYHEVMREPLIQLSRFIDKLGGPGTRSLTYVDTGPILERDLAQRSGIGFVGKHTNVISRELGNWIFLAEILTTLELPPDTPEKNRCGSCTRCLQACPTQAITAPFKLDARRCISYLTIELKGSIPVELRPAIGNRIFGCDDCLAVCPWNRFAQAGQLMKDHARPDLAQPDLQALLGLDEAAFKKQFAGTPMLRTKRRGFLRNVCVALGNTGDQTALPALQKAASDPEPLIAEHAQWAIAQIEARARTGDNPDASAEGRSR